MNDDTVRHLWSDAELDEALAALNPHETSTDRVELDRARTSLMRAAAAASDSDEPVVPQRKKRSGAWRWIAVAAAVAVLTGGVVVARELASTPSTLAPAGPASTREAGAPFTHLVTKYTGTAWVGGSSVFRVREQVEMWIPADPAGVWKRRWSRSEPPELLSGKPQHAAKLPGPAQNEESAPGGRFSPDLRSPSGATDLSPDRSAPDPEALVNLPANSGELRRLLFKDQRLQQLPAWQNGPTPQPLNYGGEPPFQVRINYPSATGLILGVLSSERIPRDTRIAFLKLLDSPVLGFSSVISAPTTPGSPGSDQREYVTSNGLYKVLVTVSTTRVALTDVRVIAESPLTGLAPGTLASSAQYSSGITDRAGD
ncbi:hypothetical protein [Amycolatopsis sp. WGS_07]|uniref:hypothetical protein n=1 Tax=Amycolatopsis sp. WGS_07 TaxID=3076764 RepID=UPI003872D1A0